MILRKRMRNDNQDYIYAGKNKLSLLLFGPNHPHYHQLIFFEKKWSLIAHEVRSIKYTSLVLSQTRRFGHNQSSDSVTEEINKDTKRNLAEVLNKSQWWRWFKILKTIRNAGVTGQKSKSYETKCDIKKEIRIARALMRQNKYLKNPFEVQQHTDIAKSTLLADNLVNFTAIAKKFWVDVCQEFWKASLTKWKLFLVLTAKSKIV